MKRLLVPIVLFAVALPLFAFDTKRAPLRVGLLRADLAEQRDVEIANAILDSLEKQLRARGFDAFDAEVTWKELEQRGGEELAADYFVEVLDTDGYSDSRGGVGVGTDHAGVSMEVMAAKVATELRVYDARTLELVAKESLAKRNRSVVPTGIGIGGRAFYAIVAVPLQRMSVRNTAQKVATQAAGIIANALRER
jgi:hypothetical protein